MAKQKTASDYFKKIDPELAPIATQLRSLVGKTAPQLREALKWNAPVYEGAKMVLWLRAEKKYVNFGFFRGAELPDPEGVLEGSGKLMRHIRVHSLKVAKAKAVRDLVRAATELDA